MEPQVHHTRGSAWELSAERASGCGVAPLPCVPRQPVFVFKSGSTEQSSKSRGPPSLVAAASPGQVWDGAPAPSLPVRGTAGRTRAAVCVRCRHRGFGHCWCRELTFQGAGRDRKAPTVTNQTATCSAKGVSRPPAVHVHSSRLRTSTASARSRAPPPGSRPAPPGASRSPSPEGPPAGRRCVAQTTERPPRPVPPATRPHCPAWRFWETLGS
eukprot:XP_028349314.1 uncharacterized protein LOC114486834 isoform X1 [Physeter catodon]